jgi:hypothetical protein
MQGLREKGLRTEFSFMKISCEETVRYARRRYKDNNIKVDILRNMF